MKKVLFVAALALASASAYAQRPIGTLTIQPKVGLNIASLTDADDTESRIGLAIGAELEYQATDLFAISGGLLYSMQGAKIDLPNTDSTIKLDYVNIPILANVYVIEGLAVKLGIQPGFNVNSKTKVEIGGTSVEREFDANTVDFSIPVGLSYEYNNFVIDGRYNWGLTKAMDGSSSKNSVFQLTLGYKFTL